MVVYQPTAYELMVLGFMGSRAYTEGHLLRYEHLCRLAAKARTPRRQEIIDRNIREVIECAVERYQDWASD